MADFEENVEEMVGTTREAVGGDRVRWGRVGRSRRTKPATRRWRRLVTNETATTGGKLEFDEDEMAALEGQRLVAEFRC